VEQASQPARRLAGKNMGLVTEANIQRNASAQGLTARLNFSAYLASKIRGPTRLTKRHGFLAPKGNISTTKPAYFQPAFRKAETEAPWECQMRAYRRRKPNFPIQTTSLHLGIACNFPVSIVIAIPTLLGILFSCEVNRRFFERAMVMLLGFWD
jgi:hypothetical protein